MRWLAGAVEEASPQRWSMEPRTVCVCVYLLGIVLEPCGLRNAELLHDADLYIIMH